MYALWVHDKHILVLNKLHRINAISRQPFIKWHINYLPYVKHTFIRQQMYEVNTHEWAICQYQIPLKQIFSIFIINYISYASVVIYKRFEVLVLVVCLTFLIMIYIRSVHIRLTDGEYIKLLNVLIYLWTTPQYTNEKRAEVLPKSTSINYVNLPGNRVVEL